MTYLDLINHFERWLEANYLPISSQLLWYKLIALFNRCGWSEWITVDNLRLMGMMQMSSEKTLIRCRDKLIESGLFQYVKGTKSSPNRYKICTDNFSPKMTVNMGVEKTENTGDNISDINRTDKDAYLCLFNQYKNEILHKSFGEKIMLIHQCKKEELYFLLTEEEKMQLTVELMSFQSLD